jgi:phenylalanyl-tRNA synthetase beta subunit
MTTPEPFTHRIRVRYAEVDGQGVVFNAHWLTYFDDASTRFFEWMGFPPAVAFVVGDDVPAGAIVATLRDALGAALEDARPFDVFRSEAVGEGRHSIAVALRLRPTDHTLTDAEAGELRARAIDAVVAAHGAELRG